MGNISMPKTFDWPDIGGIKDPATKKAMEELLQTLTFQYERLRESTATVALGNVAFIGDPLTDGSWKFEISGSGATSTLTVKVRISGTWKTVWGYTQT